jgi:hypothetical protein
LELLPRRELEEAFEDEPLRLELPERLLDDFVAWAIFFQPFSFASLRAAFALAAVFSLYSPTSARG